MFGENREDFLNYVKDADLFQSLIDEHYSVYQKPIEYPMSSKRLESLEKIAQMQKYYQCNPIRFIDDFFNIELLDVQSLIIQRSWNCPNVLVVATRGLGKSTMIDLEIMAKDMLFSNYWCFIAAGSGGQAEQTFTTLERLANDGIDTFMGSTGRIFKNEVEISNANGDGFSHSSNGFKYNTYNGSMTMTLNSNIDSKRGFRGSVIFDESGFLSEEMMNVYGAFAIVNKSFKSGKDASGKSIDSIRIRTFPTNIPNQKFYISSASSTSTKFYRLYREFSKKQIIGLKDHCVIHADCEIAFRPTIKGKVVNPLLSKADVENEMRTNPEKARREYYCEFTTDAGTNAIVSRGTITRNEETRKPLLCNDTGNKKFIITYDPARKRDNSVITVAEIYGFEEKDIKARIVNCVNLIDISKKSKHPMQTPEQIEFLKKLILDYNAGADAYGNILGVYIDAGSGGGGVNIPDFLMPDWTSMDGTKHRGLIDKEYSEEYVKKYPNAVPILHLMSPSAYKSIMYEALIELMNQDKIKFTATYDNKGYLSVFDVDEKLIKSTTKRVIEECKEKKLTKEETQLKIDEALSNLESVRTKQIKLDKADEQALASIDAMKEELVNMVRKPRDSGRDSFELCPEKANRMHDDRAYTCCMLGYGLMNERRKLITQRKKPDMDGKRISQILPIKKPILHKR